VVVLNVPPFIMTYAAIRQKRLDSENAQVVNANSNAFASTAVITRAANLDAYLANDQYGATITLENFGVPRGFVILQEFSITMNIAVPIPTGMGAGRLFLFSATPNPARADNGAFALPQVDSNSCLTKEGIPFTFRAGRGGGSCVAEVTNLARILPVPISGSVFACIVTEIAFTPAAVSELGVLTLITVEP